MEQQTLSSVRQSPPCDAAVNPLSNSNSNSSSHVPTGGGGDGGGGSSSSTTRSANAPIITIHKQRPRHLTSSAATTSRDVAATAQPILADAAATTSPAAEVLHAAVAPHADAADVAAAAPLRQQPSPPLPSIPRSTPADIVSPNTAAAAAAATANNNNNNNNAEREREGRVIDGVLYPRVERQIDMRGYEETKHGLRFRGADWDLVLTGKREELTKAVVREAALATGEPEENVQNLRFVLSSAYLYTKLTVRHRASVSLREVQSRLAKSPWASVKALYEPRTRTRRPPPPPSRQQSTMLGDERRQRSCKLTSFGRVDVGPEGPHFVDDRDRDEEPPPYEEQEAARARMTANSLVATRIGSALI